MIDVKTGSSSQLVYLSTRFAQHAQMLRAIARYKAMLEPDNGYRWLDLTIHRMQYGEVWQQ